LTINSVCHKNVLSDIHPVNGEAYRTAGGIFARLRQQVFLALCFRVVVAVTNHGRGHNPGRTKLKTL